MVTGTLNAEFRAGSMTVSQLKLLLRPLVVTNAMAHRRAVQPPIQGANMIAQHNNFYSSVKGLGRALGSCLPVGS